MEFLPEDIFLAGPIYVVTILKKNRIVHQFCFSKQNIAEEKTAELEEQFPEARIELRQQKIDALTRVEKALQ